MSNKHKEPYVVSIFKNFPKRPEGAPVRWSDQEGNVCLPLCRATFGNIKKRIRAELMQIGLELHYNHECSRSRECAQGILGSVIKEIETHFEIPQPSTLISSKRHKKKRVHESEHGNLDEYRIFFAHAPIPMAVFSVKDFRFLDVNEAALDLYGYTKEEFMSLTALDIRPPEDIPAFLNAISSAPEDRLYTFGIWRHLAKSGRIIFVDVVSQFTRCGGELCKITMIKDLSGDIRFTVRGQ